MKNENLKEDNLGSSEDILNISQKVCARFENRGDSGRYLENYKNRGVIVMYSKRKKEQKFFLLVRREQKAFNCSKFQFNKLELESSWKFRLIQSAPMTYLKQNSQTVNFPCA